MLFDGDFIDNGGSVFDPTTNRLYYIDWSQNFYFYDASAGFARTQIGSGLGSHDGGALILGSAVPEPTTLALCGVALAGGLAVVRRRKSRRVRSAKK